MQKWILILFFVVTGKSAYCTQGFAEVIGHKSICVINNSDGISSLNRVAAEALLFYLDKFSRDYWGDSACLKVIFNHPERFYSKGLIRLHPKYMLNYTPTYFRDDYNKVQSQFVRKTAIVLHCRTTDFDLLEILKILDYTLRNKKHIEQQEQVWFIKSQFVGEYQYVQPVKSEFTHSSVTGSIDLIKSVPAGTIDSLLKRQPLIDFKPILKHRYYSSWLQHRNIGELAYYYQNDSMYIFTDNKVSSLAYPTIDKILALFNDTVYSHHRVLYSFKNVYAIMKDSSDYFIFSDDTTFYYFSDIDKKLTGSYVIPPYDVEYLPRRYFYREISRLSVDTVLLSAVSDLGFYQVCFDIKQKKCVKNIVPRWSNIDNSLNELKVDKEEEIFRATELENTMHQRRLNMLGLATILVLSFIFLAFTKRL